MKFTWTFLVAFLTLIGTSFGVYIASESNKSTKEALNITKESVTITRDSLEVNKKTLDEAESSGSWGKMGRIFSITMYNCREVVGHGLVLENNKLMPVNFIIEPYIEDMAFIYEKFGSETMEIIVNNLNDMFLTNNYIYTLRELNIIAGSENDPQMIVLIKEQNKNHNRWIGEHVENIKNNFCNTILEKFYKLLLEYKKSNGTSGVEN